MPRPPSRAVAIARRRRPDPAPWLPWLLLLLALLVGAETAQGQTLAPLVPPGAKIVQPAPVGPLPVEQPNIPGATKPRANPDPGIVAAPPSIGGTMSVIPPPGMQGGNQPVITGSKP